MKEALLKILSEDRRRALARQAGGSEAFNDQVELALIAARGRNFPNPDQTTAFAIIRLVRACGSRPHPEDLRRFTEAKATALESAPKLKVKQATKGVRT